MLGPEDTEMNSDCFKTLSCKLIKCCTFLINVTIKKKTKTKQFLSPNYSLSTHSVNETLSVERKNTKHNLCPLGAYGFVGILIGE